MTIECTVVLVIVKHSNKIPNFVTLVTQSLDNHSMTLS